MNKLLIGDDKVYSISESYEFYKDYSRTRENIDEIDWDIVSVLIDHANIDFIREFIDNIRWELMDSETYAKWKRTNDPRYLEFRHEIENIETDEQVQDDYKFVTEFVRRLMEK